MRRLRLVLIAGLALVGLGWPLAAGAQDYDAYARLLAAHVRPATIEGIRLHAVAYEAVRSDPSYARALADFAGVRPEMLQTDPERIAFWVNAYNLLAIKAVVDRYPVQSIKDGGSFLQSIWKKKVGTVAGQAHALDDIEHGILRARFREPRVHMAIVCASLSCPDLRLEPYTAARLDAQLEDATRRFLHNETKGVRPGADGRGAQVSSIFKWFAEDFGGAEGVVAFIRAKVEPALARRLAGLDRRGLSYLPYDWSLNDTARATASR